MKLIHEEDLATAAAALDAGELVIVPTNRWYMVCANARNADLCDSIFTAKRRPTAKSMALVIPTYEDAANLFEISDDAERLARAFWPGDLALILPWRDPNIGRYYKAVGAPNALVTQAAGVLGELAATTAVFLAATTVNVSGDAASDQPGPALTLDEVEQFINTSGLKVAVCVAGGICPASNHMTIVDCTNPDRARLQRPGLVHQRALTAALQHPLEAA
jgi:L-threonylcarbamoyladenylate synthase